MSSRNILTDGQLALLESIYDDLQKYISSSWNYMDNERMNFLFYAKTLRLKQAYYSSEEELSFSPEFILQQLKPNTGTLFKKVFSIPLNKKTVRQLASLKFNKRQVLNIEELKKLMKKDKEVVTTVTIIKKMLLKLETELAIECPDE